MFNTVNHPLSIAILFSIKKANTFSTRLKGLMFRKTPLHQEGLWIVPCNSIHMCFMYFAIDAVFLDQNKQVVKLVHSLKPWRFVAPVQGAHSVLELPVGTIEQLRLEVGHYVTF